MAVVETFTKQQRVERDELRYRCRRSHWMDPCGPPPDFRRTGLFRLAKFVNHWVCVKCGTCRHDAVNATGGLLARRYDYPDGYLFDREEQRPTADDLRLWIAKKNRSMGFG